MVQAGHKITRILIQLSKRAGRGGLSIARKHKGVGLVIGAWVLLTNSPKEAAAEFFKITPAGVDAMLEGQTGIDIDFWDPEGSVDYAELKSGQVIKEGDAVWYAWRDTNDPSKVGRIDWGEVDYIIPTNTAGVVNVFVQFGQERREFRNVDYIREFDPPTQGTSWPAGL